MLQITIDEILFTVYLEFREWIAFKIKHKNMKTKWFGTKMSTGEKEKEIEKNECKTQVIEEKSE